MTEAPVPRLPWWLYFAGLVLYPSWAARRVLSSRRALVAAGVAVVVAGLALAACAAPAGGCHWRVAGVPGRAHMVCVRGAGA